MAYNILVVDDSDITRKVVIRAISMTGLEIGSIYVSIWLFSSRGRNTDGNSGN